MNILLCISIKIKEGICSQTLPQSHTYISISITCLDNMNGASFIRSDCHCCWKIQELWTVKIVVDSDVDCGHLAPIKRWVTTVKDLRC